MKVYQQIPNILTCCNILCGCLGLLTTKPEWMAVWVFIGMSFDFLDGLAARLLKAQSEMGKQLDSLADMVTFGVLPGVILYKVIYNIHYMELIYDEKLQNYLINFAYIALLIPVFSAWRLARFNLDSHQNTYFRGLPTPTSALLVASVPWIMLEDYFFVGEWLEDNSWLLFILALVIPYLSISDIPLFSLKLSSKKLKDLWVPIIFLILSGILLIVLHFLAVPIILILYFVFSFIYFKMHPIQ